MSLVRIFVFCNAVVLIFSFVIGYFVGYMPGLFPILIVSAILTVVINKRLESGRVKSEPSKEELGPSTPSE